MKQDMEIAAIPPIAYQDYPVDISIRIRQDNARYQAEISAMGQVRRAPIDMSSHDVMLLNKQLQETMQALVIKIQDGDKDADDLNESIRALAESGNLAFRRVFGHPDALSAVEELTALGGQVSIQITSEDFFLPWELMYPQKVSGPLSCEHFWGMNYTISRVIVQERRPGAFVPPKIVYATQPNLGLLTYKNLTGVAQQEIPFFQGLQAAGRIALLHLRDLDPDPAKKVQEIGEFKIFWRSPLELAHFACHAIYDAKFPLQSYVLLTDEFQVSLQDMDVYDIEVHGYPLVIMNACKTGNLNPLCTSYFAAALLKHGARGVVATECSIPDEFAADFAEQLYTHLLAGETLGDSLLATRRFFLETYHNPSGLLYSMYAPPSIRLVRSI
jgi:hypothetical protein